MANQITRPKQRRYRVAFHFELEAPNYEGAVYEALCALGGWIIDALDEDDEDLVAPATGLLPEQIEASVWGLYEGSGPLHHVSIGHDLVPIDTTQRRLEDEADMRVLE